MKELYEIFMKPKVNERSLGDAHCPDIVEILPGFCDSGLSMTTSGEQLPFFRTWGSIRSCLLKAAYLQKFINKYRKRKRLPCEIAKNIAYVITTNEMLKGHGKNLSVC